MSEIGHNGGPPMRDRAFKKRWAMALFCHPKKPAGAVAMAFKLYMEMDSQGQGAAIPDLEFAACCGVSDRSVREFKGWLVSNGFVKIIVKGARGRVTVFAAQIPDETMEALTAAIQAGQAPQLQAPPAGINGSTPARITGKDDEYRHALPANGTQLPAIAADSRELPVIDAGNPPSPSCARGLLNNITTTVTYKKEEEEREDAATPLAALEAFELYNVLAEKLGLPQARTLTPQRRKSLIARMREHGGIEAWKIALANVERSAFLQGKNDRGWRADFDFLLHAAKFTKVVEGTYGNGAHAGAKDDAPVSSRKEKFAKYVEEAEEKLQSERSRR